MVCVAWQHSHGGQTPSLFEDGVKSVNNTLLRAKFEHTFAIFTFYSRSRGISFITTSFLRTAEEQEKLFKEGKSGCDGKTRISKHQKGRARDIVIIDKNGNPIWDYITDYDVLGELWEQLGGKWGGRWFKEGKTKFNDLYHFEDEEIT